MIATARTSDSDAAGGTCVFCEIAAGLQGAGQEVPHLHFHVHPRRIGDDVLRVYPEAPPSPERKILDAWASQLQQALLNPPANGGPS